MKVSITEELANDVQRAQSTYQFKSIFAGLIGPEYERQARNEMFIKLGCAVAIAATRYYKLFRQSKQSKGE